MHVKRLPAMLSAFLTIRSWNVSVLSAALLASGAAAQGPSFTEVPSSENDLVLALSPDGRFITGTNLGVSIPFRWNRTTGQYLEMGGLWVADGSDVLSDGRVFGGLRNYNTNPYRAFRWSPEANQIDFAAQLVSPDRSMSVGSVSSDGEYGLGTVYDATTSSFNPVSINYAGGTGAGTATDLTATPGEIHWDTVLASVTLPINGTRYAYGSAYFPDVAAHRGVIWTLPFVQGVRDDSWEFIADVSPHAECFLGKAGGQYLVRGDGPDRVLPAPTTPAMGAPEPIAISDDGRVAVGKAYNPLATTIYNRDAVVWQKGQPAARLRDILAAAGVGMPAFDGAELVGVSADGSVVAGTYFIDQFLGTRNRAFAAVLPALNDNCATARAVTYGTVISSTNGATRAGVSGTCSAEGSAPDIWFSFVPLANETVSIDTCGSSFDTTLSVFQASNCATVGAALACNDDASPACAENVYNSRITVGVFAGTNYFIRVSGWNGAFGSVRLTITAPNRPVNDACGQATNVVPGTSVPFSNVNALTDSRPPCAGTPFNDIWFKSVAPENGRMTFSTCGSTINTVMAVYDASACADFSVPPIACGSSSVACTVIGGGNGTRLTVPCTAGQTLLVRVGGLFGSSGTGDFSSKFACDADVYSPYSAAVRNSGPIDYWRFEDSGNQTVADAMRFDPYLCGNVPGQYVGAVGRINEFHGKALNLDGTGAYARVWGTTNVADAAQCPGSNGGATLEAWIKTTDPLAGVVLANRTNPGEYSLTLVVGYNPIGIHNTAGRVMFVADGPGVFFGTISGARVDDGRWHHIVGRRRPIEGGLFYHEISVDNSFRGSTTLAGVGTATSGLDGAYWNIGNGPAWAVADAAFNGRIDDVAIYCGSLADGDIASHYTIGRPCLADFNSDGALTVQDIFDFLAAWFAGDAFADFNRVDGVSVQDIFDFLAAWFAGC
jgi:hypothetical protein